MHLLPGMLPGTEFPRTTWLIDASRDPMLLYASGDERRKRASNCSLFPDGAVCGALVAIPRPEDQPKAQLRSALARQEEVGRRRRAGASVKRGGPGRVK